MASRELGLVELFYKENCNLPPNIKMVEPACLISIIMFLFLVFILLLFLVVVVVDFKCNCYTK